MVTEQKLFSQSETLKGKGGIPIEIRGLNGTGYYDISLHYMVAQANEDECLEGLYVLCNSQDQDISPEWRQEEIALFFENLKIQQGWIVADFDMRAFMSAHVFEPNGRMSTRRLQSKPHPGEFNARDIQAILEAHGLVFIG